jgi:acetyl esterase/lipase
MTKLFLFALCFFSVTRAATAQQKVVNLYDGAAPGSEKWNWQEKFSDSNVAHLPLIYNVVQPTLTIYLPPPALANGTAVIVAPGGAFHILSIQNEGIDVAQSLTKRGIAAFVLKYRLVRSNTNDPINELKSKMLDFKKLDEENDSVVSMAIADGLKAIEYVRTHAATFHVNPKRIGIMGFSAGGTVTMGTVFNAGTTNRPDFAAPIYAYMNALKNQTIAPDAPPLFICAATNDELGLVTHSTNLYNQWVKAGQKAELHIYEKGGHGFGMNKNNIPTDTWIDRFYDWLGLQGFLKREKL